ncbi:helix-turn-helix domain-containing protein [Streptomyces sp. NBC_01352]|uniref:PucR family transcriptional regulator n=1 Tax=Streptomyces sp. NBC_01352 TaxID=2903834 RepID=UPI002E33CD6E|nr:helix-turn-helix domain-containing protein [Streptomyces sp. NBC_01352]
MPESRVPEAVTVGGETRTAPGAPRPSTTSAGPFVTTATLQRAASSVLQDVDGLAESVILAITAPLPELVQDPRTAEVFRSTVLDNVVTALRALSTHRETEEFTAPPVALEFARRLAQQGVPITTMLRGYRLGQAAFQQRIIARIAAQDVAASEVADAAMALSSFAFSFIDRVSEQAVTAYLMERDTWMRHRNAVRLARVQALLDGRNSDPGELEAVTGFPSALPMVGVVVWCGRETGESDRLGVLERHLGRLASALDTGSRPALSVAPDDSTLWTWMPCSAVDPVSVADAMGEAPGGVRTTVGEPGTGLDGFRLSHRQARQAQTIALAADPAHARPLLAWSQLGPLALVGAEVGELRAWVQLVLGGLADDDEHCARMRETLWAYLSSGHSLNTAAAALHLHKNTIQYRIRKAEEARGRPLAEGRIDVEVALLACLLLGSTVLRPVVTPRV